MSGHVTDLTVDATGIAVLTMCDERRQNALSIEMVEEIERRCAAIAQDDRVKAVIVAGTPEYFSTGADREVLEELAAGRVKPGDLLLPRVLLDIPVPVVAAMEGHTLGGGLALAVCADVTIAARESRYGATFMRYGFTPGLGLTALLELVVGQPVAHEMLLTGDTFRGSRFERTGGFTHVLPRTEVLPKARAIAAALAEKPRAPLAALKQTLSARKRELFEAARADECLMHQLSFPTSDVRQLLAEQME